MIRSTQMRKSRRRVSYNMTLGHGSIHKKVGDMMGGQIMDLEWIRAWREAEATGMEKGLEKGIEEGKAEGIEIFIADKKEDGIPDEIIKEKLKKYYKLSDEELRNYFPEEES